MIRFYCYFLCIKSSNSRGANVGISYNQTGAGYAVSLSSAVLDSRVNYNTQIGTSFMELTIGTPENQLPIHITAVPIHRALNDNLWAVNDRTSIQQKRSNLQRALEEYARNKQAQIVPGM